MKKTPEEIKQLAESCYGTEIGSIRGGNKYDLEAGRKNGFIKGYTQCQQDNATQLSEWQLCPKCLGEGRITSNGLTTSVHQQCDVCNGAKTLIKPVIQLQQDNAEKEYTKEQMIDFAFDTYCYISGIMKVPFNQISENKLHAEDSFEYFLTHLNKQ